MFLISYSIFILEINRTQIIMFYLHFCRDGSSLFKYRTWDACGLLDFLTKVGKAVAIKSGLLVAAKVFTVIVLVPMLQLHSWPLNSMKQTVNKARSNAGLVPTNKLLAALFVAPLHVKRRPLINAGYVHERAREHYSKLSEVIAPK